MMATMLEPVASTLVFGDLDDLETELYRNAFDQLDLEAFRDKKIVVKGCGEYPTPAAVFLDFTKLLRPVVDKLMFGEPCSSVPIYRKARKKKA